MRLKFTFNPLRLMLIIAVLLIGCSMVSADTIQKAENININNWLTRNWAVIAVVISESLALLPTKVNGLIHGLWSLLGSILKKK